MNNIRNGIWNLHVGEWGLEEQFKKLYDDGVETIYIYPYGNLGMKLHNYLEKKFSFKKIICVDEKLKWYNNTLIGLQELKNDLDIAKQEKVKVILASNNEELFVELRLELSEFVSDKFIIDIYGQNPLEYNRDSRIATLAQVAKQIYCNNVLGSVAEVGVYQGDFAKYINMLFPRKPLYLFDTFSGFKENMVTYEDNKLQTECWINLLKDTSVKTVVDKLPYKEQAVIRKGIFPDTANDINEIFAFVNLDTDLYESIYDGLLFFWPRMSAGGYIFVHDFGQWDGVTRAILRFCKENTLGYVVLPDGVTVCLAKPL